MSAKQTTTVTETTTTTRKKKEKKKSGKTVKDAYKAKVSKGRKVCPTCGRPL